MILTMAMLHPTAISLTASGYLCQERKLLGNYVSNILSRPTQFSGKELLQSNCLNQRCCFLDTLIYHSLVACKRLLNKTVFRGTYYLVLWPYKSGGVKLEGLLFPHFSATVFPTIHYFITFVAGETVQ